MKQATKDRLRQVADVYLDAAQHGDPAPAKAVARRLQVSHTVARNLVQRARTANILDPPPKHSATMAVIRRGTATEQRWRVCGECLTRWPCALWRGES